MLNHDPDRDPLAYADYLDWIAAKQAAPLATGWGAFAYALLCVCGAALVGVGILALTAPALALFLGR